MNMKELLQNLVKLQSIEFGRADSKDTAPVTELRGKIPAQILAHYDRLMARGKKGIVPVSNQVCRGCQMQLPTNVIMTLMRNEDIQLCDSCGRYLYLPAAEPADTSKTVVESKPVKKPRKRKVAEKPAAV
jgi:hypothetical protein